MQQIHLTLVFGINLKGKGRNERLPYSCLRLEALGIGDVQSEDDQGTDSELDPHNWQQLVGREVLAGLRPQEIKRQEVINGECKQQPLVHKSSSCLIYYNHKCILLGFHMLPQGSLAPPLWLL